ncbi:Uncharacterised protein [uncultured Clostridium sp.]|nr:Uncharacterised protein [uncultured Clostridium sp.]
MDRDTRRDAPASTVVAMPILRNIWEAVTRVPFNSSSLMVMDSTFKSFWSSPLRYSSLWLLALMSWMFSMHSWIPSEAAIFLPFCLRSIRSTMGLVPAARRNDTGATHSTASPILQSAAKRPMPMSMVEIRAPISSGIKWENAFSTKAQSAIMVVVRSARSLFPKKERGRVLSRSARRMRIWALSL